MTNQTTETDAEVYKHSTMPTGCVPSSFARKLERERDETRRDAELARSISEHLGLGRVIKDSFEVTRALDERLDVKRTLTAELTQLRKVCDDAIDAITGRAYATPKMRIETDSAFLKVVNSYSTLPHVARQRLDKDKI